MSSWTLSAKTTCLFTNKVLGNLSHIHNLLKGIRNFVTDTEFC